MWKNWRSIWQWFFCHTYALLLWEIKSEAYISQVAGCSFWGWGWVPLAQPHERVCKDQKILSWSVEGNRQFLLWVKSFVVQTFSNISQKKQVLWITRLGITKYFGHVMEVWVVRCLAVKKGRPFSFGFSSTYQSYFIPESYFHFKTYYLIYCRPSIPKNYNKNLDTISTMPLFELTRLKNDKFIFILFFALHNIKTYCL